MITKKKIFKLWIPLAVMWIVMALESPMITSIISRLPDAINQLAAFGFSFALALLVEGPVIQMLSAGTAVTSSKASYQKILSIQRFIAIVTMSIHIILSITPVFSFFALNIMKLPPELLTPAHRTFVVLIPWAPTIGYRRLWQGVMIKHGRSKYVPIVMYIRIGLAAIILSLGLAYKPFEGALLGGITLSLGVISGMISAYIFAKPCIDALPDTTVNDINKNQMIAFYVPLAITSIITLGVRPLLNIGIVRGTFPVDSLALWPIVLAYIFLYTSICQSLQEIIIAEYSKENLKVIKSFVNTVALVMMSFYIVIYLVRPLWRIWFVNISNTPKETLKYLPISLALFIIMPIVSANISWFRAILVAERKTTSLTYGVFVNVGTLLSIIYFVPVFVEIPGVYLASIAYILSYTFESLFLFYRSRKLKIGIVTS
ncbi:MAG: hypothetical protein JJE21_02545 [Spirochaetaceae bacterium]|nr:hypothetical protein [Spirochaetaceae bacterium]